MTTTTPARSNHPTEAPATPGSPVVVASLDALASAEPVTARIAAASPDRPAAVVTDEAAPSDADVVAEAADGQAQARTGNSVAEADVAGMFDAITPVYDRMNTLMTLGSDARWRRRACVEAGLRPADAVLDVACGTGKLTALLAEVVGPFGRVEGVDLSPQMIERAADTHRSRVQMHFQVANALALPFADAEFDAATIAFGLRNLADYEAGFRELRRVVRPGGRVVCLELSLPRSRAWARLFHATFRRAAPMAASIAGGRRAAYRYLPDSLDGFPTPERLATMMRSAGLADVRFWRLSTGVVALHRGTVPD
jgi:demethylmenaquinone methyltransferase/2-methoxy-6-polyprenyl-1,4-benzoquinol methylase